MILKAYKYRLYPNKIQQLQIRQNCGCVRFVYNYFLSMRMNTYAEELLTISYNQCSRELTALKKYYLWLMDADSTSLQSALKDLDTAYQKFFSKQGGYPKYKSRKNNHQSYTTKNNGNSVRMHKNSITLPKLGAVRTKVSRPADGRILRATVSFTPSGKYFVSVICESPKPLPYSGGKTIGLDLGLRDFAVLSDSLKHIPNPEPLTKHLKRLAHEQRSLSRKTSGSRRYHKQRIKVARCHERISNARRDFHHKLSTELIRKYSFIGTEDLDVKQLLADNDHTSARRIADSGWNGFVAMLSYKAEWYGRIHVKVDRYYPSSQTCHDCGYQHSDVKTKRLAYWTCPNCGIFHQRDENACLNILDESLRLYNTQ